MILLIYYCNILFTFDENIYQMKPFRILILTLSFIIVALHSFAQFNWAQIGVDGLTCSACTRSVEMSIRKLTFVDSVTMNLEHTTGKITFKKGAKVEIDKIAKAVTDAGFSLRSLYAGINISELKVTENACWQFENNTYHFIKIPDSKDFKGIVSVQFIGEKFMPKKEYKNWKQYCKDTCTPPTPQPTAVSKTYYVSVL